VLPRPNDPYLDFSLFLGGGVASLRRGERNGREEGRGRRGERRKGEVGNGEN